MPRHPVFARLYALVVPAMDAAGLGEYRRQLLAGLSGRVIEVGAGDGANFAHYPREVTEVLAVEPEPHLRRAARRRAIAQADSRVRVVAGVAERLPAREAGFDAAVATLVLCSVADQRRVLRELYRVIRPGGQLRFFEHVRADSPAMRRVQRVLDASVWPVVAGGCHTGRDTVAAMRDSGFEVDRLRKIRFPDGRFATPVSTHVHGVATRT